MCARNEEGAAVGNALERFVPLRFFHAAFEQHNRVAKDFAKIDIMLLG